MHASPDILKIAHNTMSFETHASTTPLMQIRLSVRVRTTLFVQKNSVTGSHKRLIPRVAYLISPGRIYVYPKPTLALALFLLQAERDEVPRGICLYINQTSSIDT